MPSCVVNPPNNTLSSGMAFVIIICLLHVGMGLPVGIGLPVGLGLPVGMGCFIGEGA